MISLKKICLGIAISALGGASFFTSVNAQLRDSTGDNIISNGSVVSYVQSYDATSQSIDTLFSEPMNSAPIIENVDCAQPDVSISYNDVINSISKVEFSQDVSIGDPIELSTYSVSNNSFCTISEISVQFSFTGIKDENGLFVFADQYSKNSTMESVGNVTGSFIVTLFNVSPGDVRSIRFQGASSDFYSSEDRIDVSAQLLSSSLDLSKSSNSTVNGLLQFQVPNNVTLSKGSIAQPFAGSSNVQFVNVPSEIFINTPFTFEVHISGGVANTTETLQIQLPSRFEIGTTSGSVNSNVDFDANGYGIVALSGKFRDIFPDKYITGVVFTGIYNSIEYVSAPLLVSRGDLLIEYSIDSQTWADNLTGDEDSPIYIKLKYFSYLENTPAEVRLPISNDFLSLPGYAYSSGRYIIPVVGSGGELILSGSLGCVHNPESFLINANIYVGDSLGDAAPRTLGIANSDSSFCFTDPSFSGTTLFYSGLRSDYFQYEPFSYDLVVVSSSPDPIPGMQVYRTHHAIRLTGDITGYKNSTSGVIFNYSGSNYTGSTYVFSGITLTPKGYYYVRSYNFGGYFTLGSEFGQAFPFLATMFGYSGESIKENKTVKSYTIRTDLLASIDGVQYETWNLNLAMLKPIYFKYKYRNNSPINSINSSVVFTLPTGFTMLGSGSTYTHDLGTLSAKTTGEIILTGYIGCLPTGFTGLVSGKLIPQNSYLSIVGGSLNSASPLITIGSGYDPALGCVDFQTNTNYSYTDYQPGTGYFHNYTGIALNKGPDVGDAFYRYYMDVSLIPYQTLFKITPSAPLFKSGVDAMGSYVYLGLGSQYDVNQPHNKSFSLFTPEGFVFPITTQVFTYISGSDGKLEVMTGNNRSNTYIPSDYSGRVIYSGSTKTAIIVETCALNSPTTIVFNVADFDARFSGFMSNGSFTSNYPGGKLVQSGSTVTATVISPLSIGESVSSTFSYGPNSVPLTVSTMLCTGSVGGGDDEPEPVDLSISIENLPSSVIQRNQYTFDLVIRSDKKTAFRAYLDTVIKIVGSNPIVGGNAALTTPYFTGELTGTYYNFVDTWVDQQVGSGYEKRITVTAYNSYNGLSTIIAKVVPVFEGQVDMTLDKDLTNNIDSGSNGSYVLDLTMQLGGENIPFSSNNKTYQLFQPVYLKFIVKNQDAIYSSGNVIVSLPAEFVVTEQPSNLSSSGVISKYIMPSLGSGEVYSFVITGYFGCVPSGYSGLFDASLYGVNPLGLALDEVGILYGNIISGSETSTLCNQTTGGNGGSGTQTGNTVVDLSTTLTYLYTDYKFGSGYFHYVSGSASNLLTGVSTGMVKFYIPAELLPFQTLASNTSTGTDSQGTYILQDVHNFSGIASKEYLYVIFVPTVSGSVSYNVASNISVSGSVVDVDSGNNDAVVTLPNFQTTGIKQTITVEQCKANSTGYVDFVLSGFEGRFMTLADDFFQRNGTGEFVTGSVLVASGDSIRMMYQVPMSTNILGNVSLFSFGPHEIKVLSKLKTIGCGSTGGTGSNGTGTNGGSNGGGGGGNFYYSSGDTTGDVTDELRKSILNLENTINECSYSDENYHKLSFLDIEGKPYASNIMTLTNYCIVKGTGPYEFSPDKATTRAEFTKVVVKLALNGERFDFSTFKPDSLYDDVTSEDWYNTYITKAREIGLTDRMESVVNGKILYRPNEVISQRDAMIMMVKALQYAKLQNNVTEEFIKEGLSSRKVLSRSDMAKRVVDSFTLSEDIGLSLRSDNYQLLRVMFANVRTLPFDQQIKLLTSVKDKINSFDENTLKSKYNIYKKGIITIIDLLIK